MGDDAFIGISVRIARKGESKTVGCRIADRRGVDGRLGGSIVGFLINDIRGGDDNSTVGCFFAERRGEESPPAVGCKGEGGDSTTLVGGAGCLTIPEAGRLILDTGIWRFPREEGLLTSTGDRFSPGALDRSGNFCCFICVGLIAGRVGTIRELGTGT
jgi:hypothetical protein